MWVVVSKLGLCSKLKLFTSFFVVSRGLGDVRDLVAFGIVWVLFVGSL